MYIYIYIHICPFLLGLWPGTTDCKTEIDTSEIVEDFQRHVPMDRQWHVPTDLKFSVAFSEGLSLSQWMLLEMSNGCSVASSNGI